MKLTLYVDWLEDKEPFVRIKSTEIEVTLPNSDMFHAFEAWLHLSRLENYYNNKYHDDMMDITYDIVQKVCYSHLGLSDDMYRNGVFEIDDPIAEDENNGSAYITIYVPKR
jgi:hypothetical protein